MTIISDIILGVGCFTVGYTTCFLVSFFILRKQDKLTLPNAAIDFDSPQRKKTITDKTI